MLLNSISFFPYPFTKERGTYCLEFGQFSDTIRVHSTCSMQTAIGKKSGTYLHSFILDDPSKLPQ